MLFGMPTDLERARRGDLQAFNRLAEPHAAVLYRLVYRVLAEPAAAEKATRAGLALAARNLRQLDGDDFELWLVRWVVAACSERACQPAVGASASPLQAALH